MSLLFLDKIAGFFNWFGDACGFYFVQAGFAERVDAHAVLAGIKVFGEFGFHLQHLFFCEKTFKQREFGPGAEAF